MADPTFNVEPEVGRGKDQTSRRIEISKRLEFAKLGDGTGLAAEESMRFLTPPDGFVVERLDARLVTAEGEAATLDFGIEADPDGLLDGGNVNGTPGASIAPAGTEAIVPGTYLGNTPIRVTNPAAGATVNVAVVDVTLVGYTVEPPTA